MTSITAPADTSGEQLRRPGTRRGIALAIAVGASSALNFAVHALSSRELSVADYGGLAAVLALMAAAAVPVAAVQTALTRSASEILARGGHPSGRIVLYQTVPIGLLICGLVAALTPVTTRFLNLSSGMPIALGGVWVAVVLIGSIGKAMLIADEDHGPVAHALIHSAILRVVAVAILTSSMGVTGGIAAALVGDLLASTIYLIAAHRSGLLDADAEPSRVAWPDAGRALSSQLSLWIFASMAVIIGRRTLSGQTSGSFAAMATAAVACLYLPQAVATIVFPRFVADGSRRLLLNAVAIAGVVGMICASALCIRPDWIFQVFFGPSYKANQIVLLVLCAHFVLLGCLTVLTQYLVARRQAGALAIWIGLGVATVGAHQFGHSPLSVSVVLLLPNAAVMVYLGVLAALSHEERHDIGRAKTPADTTSVRLIPTAGDRLREPATLDVSVVVPNYNGGQRLHDCVLAIRNALDLAPWSYEIIVADDGSTDGCAELLQLGPTVIIERSAINQGKGAALRRGFARSGGSIIGFIDGDGDIAPSVLIELVSQLRAGGAWVAVASKNQPGATVNATGRRRVMSAAYRLAVHWMFDLEVTDTQCGCKVFRRQFLAATIDIATEDGFALDLELLTIGSRLGMKRAIEVPVVLSRIDNGTITSSAAFRVLVDTLRIRRRLPPATWAPLPLTALAPVGVDFSSPLLP